MLYQTFIYKISIVLLRGLGYNKKYRFDYFVYPRRLECFNLSKYVGILCECCKKPFTEDDDVVVCPECGAPYHRDCYKELGNCAFKDKHGEGFAWQAKLPQSDKDNDDSKSIVCAHCNSVNPPDSEYCRMCGVLLNGEQQPHADNYGNYRQNANPMGGNSSHPYQDDFVVEGVSSRELIAYTGNSFYYFIRQFKVLIGNRFNISWNWAALFFNFFYFFYRKMYKIGIALFAFYIISLMPSLLCFIGETDASMQMMGITVYYNSKMMEQVAPISTLLSTVGTFLNVWCALFANKFYLATALKDIRRYKSDSNVPQGTQEYYDALYYFGRPNRFAVVVIVLIIFAFYSFSGTLMNYNIP